MSISEYISLELKVSKKRLKLQLGDLVTSIEDEKQMAMVIGGVLPIGSYENHSADFVCLALNKKGRIISKTFIEKELKKIER